MMEANITTRVIFLIDESGSMLPKAEDVRGGFNSYLEKLKGDGNNYSLSIIKFESKVHPLVIGMALDEVPQLTKENYQPLNHTALYDAIGYIFAQASKFPDVSPEHPYGTDPVLVIIMTDGQENASKEYVKKDITTGIKEREDKGAWTFVYLGADQDAWSVAGDLGMYAGNTMSFASGEMQSTFDQLAGATTATAGRQTRNFFKEQK
jgi:uncharacterized protein YegL